MTITVPRTINPVTNPAGWLSAAGAVAAAVTMLVNAEEHHGLIDPTVITAAVAAVGALLTRQIVTPVADPKSSTGAPLAPVTATASPPAVPPPAAWPSAVRLLAPTEEAAETAAGKPQEQPGGTAS